MSSPWIELLHIRYSGNQPNVFAEPSDFLQDVPELFSDDVDDRDD